MRRFILLVPVLLLAGCLGDGATETTAEPDPVTGTVALERPAAGPPDAGTAAGHGARAAPEATTRDSRFELRGTVEPADSEVRLLDGATGGQSAIARRRGEAFAFTLENLRPGVNRFVIEASRAGRAAWRQRVRVVRRGRPRRPPRRVTVPRADRSPAEAIVRLDRDRLVATAIGRDPGGMARIRVSADLRVDCRDGAGEVRELPLVRHDPPPQIGHVRVAPGRRVPGELRRRSALRPAARARCARAGAVLSSVRGVVWAEATNAAGLDRYSAYVTVNSG